MAINEQKYENVILYLIANMRDGMIHGKKKLAKLLYYVDFDRFEYKESMETITGDSYRHRPMGPVPDQFQDVVERMRQQGRINVKEIQEYDNMYRPTTVYSSDVKPDMSVFDEDDKRILERVIRHYGASSGRDLELRSHGEAPWRAVGEREHSFRTRLLQGDGFLRCNVTIGVTVPRPSSGSARIIVVSAMI